MVKVSVIESISTKKFYVGMTEDLPKRLKEHNAGRSKFTSGYMPWQIIYLEEVLTFADGRVREKYLKTAAGKKSLKCN